MMSSGPALTTADPGSGTPEARQHWLAALAKAGLDELEQCWSSLLDKPRYRALRQTETGLVMVRGRIGGTGSPFNLGEMTMTRAAIQLLDADGNPLFTGFGHVAGRSRRQAELVALFDAMLQEPARRDALIESVIEPLAAAQKAVKVREAGKVAATKVEFFTLVRGE